MGRLVIDVYAMTDVVLIMCPSLIPIYNYCKVMVSCFPSYHTELLKVVLDHENPNKGSAMRRVKMGSRKDGRRVTNLILKVSMITCMYFCCHHLERENDDEVR